MGPFVKTIISFFVPHVFYKLVASRRDRKTGRVREQNRRLREAEIVAYGRDDQALLGELSYGGMIDALAIRGCDRSEVIGGSIAEDSLKKVCDILEREFGKMPIVGLHIGNFVGVSLAYLVNFVVKLNPDSHLVSIDPNIPHRGIQNPQEEVLHLLQKYGLTRHASILVGYSLEKCIGNDGVSVRGYDPTTGYMTETSLENQLEVLAKLVPGRFNFVLIDGNHDGRYLVRELRIIDKLLSRNGLLILDDVNVHWDEIRRAYEGLDKHRYREISLDNRMAVSRKLGA